MHYQHLTESCLAAAVGDGGLSEESFTRSLMAAAPAHDRLCQLVESGKLPALGVAAGMDDLAPLRAMAEDWRRRLRDVVVLGIGGSSLGGQCVTALSDRGFGPAGDGPRLHFLDNVDPHTQAALLGAVDLKRTGVIAISKSGGTAETMAQALCVLPALAAAVGRKNMPAHAVAITEPKPSPLKSLAERHGLPCLDHDPGIGGRFSVLSLVGMLPAMIAGLDAAAVRRGAHDTLRATVDAARVEDSAPATGAAIAVALLHERRITQNVLLTYNDRLATFGLWYRQLWAESLGKDGTGMTPIRAMGAADHHSQLQLYLAGPRDKSFTIVMPETARQGPVMAADEARAVGADSLAGHAYGDLLDAAARATAATLTRHGRPVRRLVIDTVDEATLGALFMHFMLETIIAADLLGVNAFDQPAVEEGKVLTRDYLAKSAS
ncbi:MAG TPA: glucose-6-phosphate isomerase [Kiloniellales bacterium]|jgi:glucose-6-phosphate isomerase